MKIQVSKKKKKKELVFALLIDAENVAYTHIDKMLTIIEKQGKIIIKHAHADWTNQALQHWKEICNLNGIQRIQQDSHAVGKNSSDIGLVIDAMDILYAEKVNAFCIISSDSDFTKLALRLRKNNIKVVGIGKKQTIKAFVAACDEFIFINDFKENTPNIQQQIPVTEKNINNVIVDDTQYLRTGQETQQTKVVIQDTHQNKTKDISIQELKVTQIIAEAIFSVDSKVNGWVALNALGTIIARKIPNFKEIYGQSLSKIIKKLPYFEMKEMDLGKNKAQKCVKIKK